VSIRLRVRLFRRVNPLAGMRRGRRIGSPHGGERLPLWGSIGWPAGDLAGRGRCRRGDLARWPSAHWRLAHASPLLRLALRPGRASTWWRRRGGAKPLSSRST